MVLQFFSAVRAARSRAGTPAVVGVAALVLAASAPVAIAASVTGASFSGGTGTYTAGDGTVYAKQGASLTLTVNTDTNTQCVEVIDGSNAVVATVGSRSASSQWVLSDTGLYPWLVAGSGSGVVQYTTKAWKNYNANLNRCTANQNEAFGVKAAAYTLDNTRPTATGVISPAPNSAGWNNATATLSWSALDNAGGSGVKPATVPGPEVFGSDGTFVRTATVTDNVGNASTTATATVNVDRTAPAITGTRTPAANANGWNNTDVTVSFAANDPTSGIRSASGPTTLTGSAANQSVTGTATDNADNTGSATVNGINIDKVAPALSGGPTTTPNAGGWYRGDVTVAWTATDALSGTTNPANSTIGGEGTGLTASATATDRAGNTSGSVQSSPAVSIDRTAPTTSVTAPPAWNKTDVTLTLVPHDGLSGVHSTFYELDGAARTAGTSVPVTTEGTHTLTFWSTDVAGNVEEQHTVSFGIDKTSPTIGHTQSPAANAAGWNRTDVTVTFDCGDLLSGVASCTTPQTVSTEGAAQTVTGTVRDNAGNSATDPAMVSIDKTKPVLTVDALASPNSYGWYADDVTATFTASDVLSGLASQGAAHTFGEGGGQTATASATDTAGNVATVTTPQVNVDKTPPTIVGRVVETPNAAGWFSRDVTVHWTCDDALSGVVACPADSVVGGEGSNRSASASVTDKAGHTASATVTGIKIDRSPPTTSTVGVPPGWVNAPVTVGLLASDNLSDVDSTYYSVDGAEPATKGTAVTIAAQGRHTVTYWSVDQAGHTEDAQSFEVQVDLSSPTVTPSQSPDKNAAGWNNTDVAVSFACEDQVALSGLKDCTEPRTVSTEGLGQTVTGTATDNAGNSVSATATVNIDKTPPTITGAPDREANAAHWYRADVTVTFVGKDDLSGLATLTEPQHLGEGRGQAADGTATDAAGNSGATTVAGINVDKTPPTLSAAPTTEPNADGWYRTDVVQVWRADDPLSGLDGEAPAPSVLSAEGDHQTASATVSDVAGNSTSATSEAVKIDKTAPTTEVAAPEGWVNDNVEVVLTPHDSLSGPKATFYVVDGGQEQQGTVVRLTTDGTHTIAYRSVDTAGNLESVRLVEVNVDKTAPTITHELSPEPNARHWNNSDVTVTFTCEDQVGLSGIASCTAPVKVTEEVRGRTVAGTATDGAGNVGSDWATVNLDKTDPSITGSRQPAPNDHGWNNTAVTVRFDGDDELSGVDSVTPDRTLGEGTGQSVEGTVVDNAGNFAAATVSGINVDTTAPTLSGAAATEPNSQGWYRGDVTIRWSAVDERSGVAEAPANNVLEGEGTGLVATTTVSDKAGNSTTAGSSPVNIDRTAPTTGANAPTGWRNAAVTVSLEAADNLSRVQSTWHSVDGGDAVEGTTLTIASQGVHSLRYWSVDRAGNVEEPNTLTVRIDLTNPTIGHTVTPAPNARGWNRAPVTVAYQCSDALSGVASCSDPVGVDTDGEKQAVPGTAVDNAGNVTTDPAQVSIDTVAPIITAAPDRSPNSNDWYDDDVTVSFTCADVLSGIAACASPVSLGQGAAQRADGTATDVAGNSHSATVHGVNVDKTAPTLVGTPTTPANSAGWYRDDVVIDWTAADALSGVDGAAPADSTLSGEGLDLTAGASVRDLAGNQTSARSAAVNIDRTTPSTAVSDVSGWSNAAVTVTLTATDNLSGVAATHYQLDDADRQSGTAVTIDTEGTHALKVWSVDRAGNVEAPQNLEVRIDRTAPGIAHQQSPRANGQGWNNSDVVVTFTCTDVDSGIATCTPPQVVEREGAAQPVDGKAVDNAGNVATDQATVSIDRTKPTVTGSLSSQPNTNHWFRADVTATYSCDDQASLSGVVACAAARTFGEGANQHHSVTVQDAADNVSDPFTLSGINVDKTDPTLSGAVTAAPNGAGWYRGDVTVRWSAQDLLSGLDGDEPGDSIITGEGDDLSTGTAVSDRAGNTQAATVGGIKIDRHDPATSATAPGGWQNGDVTVRLVASDNLSGIAATHYRVDAGEQQSGTSLTIGTEGRHVVTFWSVDRAGNVETPSTVTVEVDKTAPVIVGEATTSPNTAGWYRTPVSVHFTCTDSLSGVAACQPDATLAEQGENSVTGFAVDSAGNRGSTTVSGLKIDTVPPAVTIGGITDGAEYTIGAVPVATASATDATSGLTSPATGTLSGGTSNGVGTFTYTATATDWAGNVGTRSVRYTVVYGFGTTLFLQPVNDTAHQIGVATSIFNAGQTIPMKFQLRNAADAVIQAGTAPRWLVPAAGGATSAAVNEATYAAVATTGSTYHWDGTHYQFNWKTDKNMSGKYWRVGVALDDGKTYYVSIGLR